MKLLNVYKLVNVVVYEFLQFITDYDCVIMLRNIRQVTTSGLFWPDPENVFMLNSISILRANVLPCNVAFVFCFRKKLIVYLFHFLSFVVVIV